MTDNPFTQLAALSPDSEGDIQRLLYIMTCLRDPELGCAWDLKQDSKSIAQYAIEEAYELLDAIQRDDTDDTRDELGDLLLQVVFHAQMAQESGKFDFSDVVKAVSEKMIRRHPHIFNSTECRNLSPEAIAEQWNAIKATERRDKHRSSNTNTAPVPHDSLLDGLTKALPALSRAKQLKRRVAQIGFDWPNAAAVLEKVQEEATELAEEQISGTDQQRLHEEFGDLAFTLAVLADHLKVDPETALRDACDKFERRFRALEADLQPNREAPPDLPTLEAAWKRVKQQESQKPSVKT